LLASKPSEGAFSYIFYKKQLTRNCIYIIITVVMKLITNPDGEQPIYEQIELQIKQQITSGELVSGTMLPSIRTLAKELKIGIITAKRAYDDLTAEGYTQSVAGRGVFVAYKDVEEISAAAEEELKKKLSLCVDYAKANGIGKQTVNKLIDGIWEEK